MKQSLLMFLGLLIFVPFLKAQEIPVDASNQQIYSFLDELADEGVIDLNSAVKPYSYSFILKVLYQAEANNGVLNKRQKSELQFYIEAFDIKRTINIKKRFDIDLYHNKNLLLSVLPPGLYYNDSNVQIRANPIWGINYHFNKNGNIRQTWGGGEFGGQIGKHVSFYASVRDNYEAGEVLALPEYFSQRQGGNYKLNEGGRKGGDFSETRGGLIFHWKSGAVALVKDNIEWGDNHHGSNILSGRTPSYGMIKLKLHPVSWFEFNYFHGWLVSEVVDSARSYITALGDNRQVFRNKFIAANMYTFKPFKGLHISAGNSIIYSDMNVQAAYLIPFLFFKSVDHTLNHKIENQNSQMFLNVSSRQIKHIHLYGSVFIDELKFSRIGVDSLHNFASYKGGFHLSNWPIKNVGFIGEYTYTSPITFKHYISTTTFETNKFNLGHYLRDNSQELYLQLYYKPIPRLFLKAEYTFAEHGNEYQYVDAGDAVRYPILDETTWSMDALKLTASYQFAYNCFLRFSYQYSNIQGFDVDGKSAEHYLDKFSPNFFHGKNSTVECSFNIGF